MIPKAAAPRLIGALWRLTRADAMAPREIDPLLPPGVRLVARCLRLLGGPESRRGRPGERLARVLEQEGPVAIKLGQFLSTRADIFGPQFAEDLSRLKDHLTPFPDAIAAAEAQRALGRPLNQIFASFDSPVGAASLAQVHAARLKDGRALRVASRAIFAPFFWPHPWRGVGSLARRGLSPAPSPPPSRALWNWNLIFVSRRPEPMSSRTLWRPMAS